MDPQACHTQCCIVGGGPAGIMLGFLLARSGVRVMVLEKHADFFRDFRGDTIHPSTLELMHELGILDAFLKLPHQPMPTLQLVIDGRTVPGPDFSRLPTHEKYVAMMPQWDFLNFIASQASRYAGFDLRMATEAVGLIENEGRVTGVIAETAEGRMYITADLVVAADGRGSVVRDQAAMPVIDIGAPIDVLWFRLAKPNDAIEDVMGRIQNGRMMVTLNRGEYYQAGLLIQKGGFERLMQQGLEHFHGLVAAIAPGLGEVVKAIDSWDMVKLLSVRVDRLERWYRPGLLCIGDAAHAMSPIGGVGVNYAVQDAVATANLLAEKLRTGRCGTADLARVQRRRAWPARVMQGLQVAAHRRFFSGKAPNHPLAVSRTTTILLRLFAPLLRRLVARVVGIGLRPEHIRSREYR